MESIVWGDIIHEDHYYALPEREERIAYEFITTVSAAKILNSLGYYEAYKDLVLAAKSLAGELSLYLSTGKYVDGLATSLADELGTLWSKDFDEFQLAELLNLALSLKAEIGVASEDTLKQKALRLLELLAKVFGVEIKSTPTLNALTRNPDPEVVLQTVCTALVVGVGGLNGG